MDDASLVAGIERHFSHVRDPRMNGKCDHRLSDMIVIAMLATLAGADGPSEIALFAQTRETWLRGFLELSNGVPSHDTFGRVLCLLDPAEFTAGLVNWSAALAEAARAEGKDGEGISLDGKTLRRSFGRKGLKALHVVSAWSTTLGLSLGQVACEEKSNEITAIPEVLRWLSLKGRVVTIDAMGCQKAIAAQIRGQKGHYVLGLKGNQPKLEATLQAWFEACAEKNFAGVRHDQWASAATAHGRVEERTCYVLELPADHPAKAKWTGLRSLVVMVSQRTIKGVEQADVRLYLSSLPAEAKRHAGLVRGHWGIENSLHWVLDVAFREDDSRMSDRVGAQNLAALRRWAVGVLRREQSTKAGANAKRFKAALDPNYLLKLLHSG